jgi:PD-(D/E)XK nuclease superfamily
MDLPALPAIRVLERISPSFYNAGIICLARAAWLRFGDKYSLPSSTGAILGSAFHAVMELGNRGRFLQGAACLSEAKIEFDKETQRLFADAHPLLKAKYATPAKIPFYSIRRSRAAALALRASVVAKQHTSTTEVHDSTAGSVNSFRIVEQAFLSKDGKVTGKLDLLEPKLGKITDYKSGQRPLNNPSGLSEPEVRQLRLYAYLAQENNYPVTEASIVRGDAAEVTIPVTATDAASEALRAKEMLQDFNNAIEGGKSFRDIASPSPNCANCPCIPFCERFWEDALPDWEEECGTHSEATILESQDSNVAGTKLKTFTLDCTRGTAPRGRLIAEQIPLDWLSIGSSVPAVGSTIRVVLAARSGTEPECRTLHVDRFKATTIWRVAA